MQDELQARFGDTAASPIQLDDELAKNVSTQNAERNRSLRLNLEQERRDQHMAAQLTRVDAKPERTSGFLWRDHPDY